MGFLGDAAAGVGQSSVFLVPHVGAPLFFTGVMGSSTGEAVKTTGELGAKEYAYGILSGATEGALETLTGAGGQAARALYGRAATKAGSSILRRATTRASQWAAQAAWRGVVKNMVSSAAGEFVEEFLGDYTDVFWKRVTGVDPEATTTLGDAMYSGLVGAVSGAFMGGGASAYDAARMTISGNRVISEGNVDATLNTARRVMEGFQTENDVNTPPALSDLRTSLAAYDAMADKTSSGAALNLGRIKADLFAVQSYQGVQQVYAELDNAGAQTLDNLAAYMSSRTGKQYSRADFVANKDGIRTAYAIEAWSMLYLGDSRAEADMASFRDIIAADQAGTASGEGGTVPGVAESASWNGSDAVYKASATGNGDSSEYIKIKKLGDDSYSIAWGADAEHMRGFASRTEAEVRDILGEIARADTKAAEDIAAYETLKSDIKRNTPELESTIAELQSFIDSGGVGKTAAERRRSVKAAQEQLRAAQAQLDSAPGQLEAQSGAAFDSMAELLRARDRANAGERVNEGVSYTGAEQDAARKLVKDFDTLHPDVRRAVMEWLRSSQSLDKKTQRAVANIIAVRRGLFVLNAELGKGHRGLYSDALGEGARLAVIDAKQAGEAARDVITHELTHDLESVKGYTKLKKAALASTSEARRREIIDQYVSQYEGAQPYSEWLGSRAGTAATWAEYLKAFPMVDGELIEREVVARAVADKLGSVRFIDKYAERNVLSRAINSLRRLFRALKTAKADETSIAEVVKLGRAFEGAMSKERTEGRGVRTSAHDVAEEEYLKPITVADIKALQEIGRKSVNDFTPEELKKAQKWAHHLNREPVTKSPFFRAWFGDWRANDTSPIEVVTVPTIDISQAYLRRGDYHIKDTDWTVHAGSALESETSHYARGEKISQKALSSVEEILNNAILLNTEVSVPDSSKKNKLTAFMHKLYTPISYNGRKYIAKIAIEEFYNEGTQGVQRRAYHLQGIRIEPAGGSYADNSATTPRSDTGPMSPAPGGMNGKTADFTMRTSGDTVSVSQRNDFVKHVDEKSSENGQESDETEALITMTVSELYDLVKKFDKDFSAGSQASAVSNADGTPRVMYHGTNGGDFTVFDSSKSDKRVRLNALGDGYYFTETAERAERYGERVIDAYLDIKKPYRFYARDGGIRAQMAEDFKLDADSINRHDIQSILKEHGYDGVLLYHSKYDDDADFSTAVVFEPTQIKSATNNIGTYDRTNPDIRYDLAEGEPTKKAEKKATGEADAAAKAEKAERRRAERQQSAETMQTEQEEISARRSGRVYRADYVKGVTREVRKIYGNVFDATMSRRLSGKLHEYFNLYDEKTAVQLAMRAISELYVDQRVNYEKKLAQNELDIEKALREGKTPPKRLEPLPELSELSRQNDLAEQYLRRAYKQGGERVDGGYSYQTKNDRELNQLRTENETLKTVSNIRTQINAIKKRAEGYKRVGSNFGQDMDAVMRSAGGVLHGTTVNVVGAINFANEVLHMLRNEAPDMVALMEAINREGGLSDDMLSAYQEKLNASKSDNDVAQIFDDVTQDLINIANIGQYYTEGEQRKVTPTRGLTLEELKTIEKTMREVIAADTRHGRVYIDGEWVDAIPFAELTVGAASKVYGAGKDVMLRTMTSTGMIETIQPAMLMQVLEGTAGDRHSSLSTMYNEIMQADLDRQVQRVELTKDIDEFMNDGKEINGVKMGGRKYQKHYSTDSITVELPIPGRGKVAVNMTIGEAQAFVMTFKREQARPTFALNAFEFRDRKKRGKDYTGRVIERMEIAEDADYDDVMTRLLNEIGKTVAEVSRQLTDEDRALMRMAEKFFEQSKTIKMGADMTLLGKTNIIAGYYFPILRSALGRDANYINSGVAEYSPSTRSYSWNKKTIRNASGRIVIGELLDIINSHAEQLTTCANMSIPIQNLQRMVNTRLAEPVSDCRTVREYISRRVYAGFDKYMNKLISDLQGRRRIGNELDAKIESALGHRTVVQSPITSFKLEKH